MLGQSGDYFRKKRQRRIPPPACCVCVSAGACIFVSEGRNGIKLITDKFVFLNKFPNTHFLKTSLYTQFINLVIFNIYLFTYNISFFLKKQIQPKIEFIHLPIVGGQPTAWCCISNI